MFVFVYQTAPHKIPENTYIYIYIERERERERETSTSFSNAIMIGAGRVS
jgi:hypothetical protein